jgi:hypothetical protein
MGRIYGADKPLVKRCGPVAPCHVPAMEANPSSTVVEGDVAAPADDDAAKERRESRRENGQPVMDWRLVVEF